MELYKSFLGPREPLVLPYFGGTRVDAADRRLRVASPIEPGWWKFELDGRRAVPREPAPPVDLGSLPAVRGHWTDGWVVAGVRDLGRISLPPEDEPAPLARVTARRWYSGELLLESIDFEDSAETSARQALEERRSIAEVRDVVPSLRAAFAFAFAMAVARELRVPVSLREIAPHVVAIGDGGRAAVDVLLDQLVAERRRAEEVVRERIRRADERARELAALAVQVEEEGRRQQRIRAAVSQARGRRRPGDPADLADAALESANARMLSCRRIAGGRQLEVRLVVDDVRLTSTVEASTLQVLDAGICLAGSDREVTLDSLPSVVREAIRTHRLVITRHD